MEMTHILLVCAVCYFIQSSSSKFNQHLNFHLEQVGTYTKLRTGAQVQHTFV